MKKHTSLLLILVIACGGAARAQVQPAKPHPPAPLQSRWSVDCSGGVAFPAGQFAHPDEQNPKSGPVQTGSIVELSGTYHLNHAWGITLLANQQHHSSEVHNFYPPSDPGVPEIPVAMPPNPGPGFAYQPIGPQHWTMTRILAGGVYTLPLNQKKNLALLVRALAGVQKTHAPAYEYLLQIQNVTAFSSFPARNLAWAFSYQADAGLQWKVYRRWSLLTLAGYNGCRPSYDQDITQLIESGGLLTPNAPHVFKKIVFPTNSILFRAGVRYDL